MANETKNPQASSSGAKRQNSTTDYPMVELRGICEFVHTIREQGVESESMPVIAKESGYSSPTSTGFYRRIVAARLFGMIELQGARLTSLAMDFLKPDSDDAKTKSLREAVRAIPSYQPLLEKYSGQKLNPEIIKNGIVRTSNLSDECALICAKVFVESLRFAGELDAEYTLLGAGKIARSEPAKDSDKNSGKPLTPNSHGIVTDDGELETYSLTLDASKKRRVVVKAPPQVTRAELKRIQDWLSFQLLVEETGQGELQQ